MPAAVRPAWRGRCACGGPTCPTRRRRRRDAGAAPAAGHGRALGAVRRDRGRDVLSRCDRILVVGGDVGSGHAIAGIRLRGELLPGVAPSPLVRACAAADFSNGLSAILPFEEWLVGLNTELTVHLHRGPAGELASGSTRRRAGGRRDGLGERCAARSGRGRFGTRRAQSLFVERRVFFFFFFFFFLCELRRPPGIAAPR